MENSIEMSKNTNFTKDQIIIYGESLGSGVAVELGAKYGT